MAVSIAAAFHYSRPVWTGCEMPIRSTKVYILKFSDKIAILIVDLTKPQILIKIPLVSLILCQNVPLSPHSFRDAPAASAGPSHSVRRELLTLTAAHRTTGFANIACSVNAHSRCVGKYTRRAVGEPRAGL